MFVQYNEDGVLNMLLAFHHQNNTVSDSPVVASAGLQVNTRQTVCR